MALIDVLSIMGIALLSALLIEAINWFLIYRTESYKSTLSTIERLTKKVQKSSGSAKNKKAEKYKETLASTQRNMFWIRMKSTVVLFVVMISIYNIMSARHDRFGGQVVAKLPFEPVSFIRGISHRGLPGEDWTDCSFAFIYVLSSIVFKAVLPKLLGTSQPAANFGSMFDHIKAQ